MKRCTVCGEKKDESQFFWKNKSQGRRAARCKACHKEYRDKHYKRNRKKRIAQARVRANRIKSENKQRIREYLSQNPCVDCNETDIIVLQFDHVRGKKLAMVTVMAHNGSTWPRIAREIAKCEVRCANCHIRRHHYAK